MLNWLTIYKRDGNYTDISSLISILISILDIVLFVGWRR